MLGKRRIGPPSVWFLQPAVHAKVHCDLLPGSDLCVRGLDAVAKCKLLLVVGVSLKCGDTFDLIYDAVAQVHNKSGAVVYMTSRRSKVVTRTNALISSCRLILKNG